MEIKCLVIELKPNSLERVKKWAEFIKENEVSALKSLQNETVTVENFFFVTLVSKDYLIGYMRAKSFEVASTTIKESLSEIDAYHKEFQQETWVNGTKAELMVSLSRIHNEDEIA
jgi:hypothetical protein